MKVSRFAYKCVPFFGTKGRGRDSRAHKANGTMSRPVLPSRFVPRVSRFVSRWVGGDEQGAE